MASAPAKIILFGEHAVVHRQPAIAVPISGLRATATSRKGKPGSGLQIEAADLNEVVPVEIGTDIVDNALVMTARLILRALAASPPDAIITVKSTIPMASGLGSGAAVSTALARALAETIGTEVNRETLNNLILEVERIYHGTPSGIDNTVIVYEQPVFFVRGQPIELLTIAHPFTLVVGDTGETALTRIAVRDVGKLVKSQPKRMQPLLDEVGEISRKARPIIESGDPAALGPLMLRNHALLQQMTVSCESLDRLVQAAMDAGAVGAKLSGGGRGGNMIALVTPDQQEQISQALVDAGAVRVFTSVVGS